VKVPGQPVADSVYTTLKFSDSYLLVQGASAGALNTLSYKLNSLYKPNHTANTGQYQGIVPLSDQFMKAVVVSSHIRWRFRHTVAGINYGSLGLTGTAATHSGFINAVLYPLPTAATAVTTLQQAAVQKYATKRFDFPMELVGDFSAPVTSSEQINPAQVWRGTHTMNVAKLDGQVSTSQAAYEHLFASGDPTDVQYWLFNFQDVLSDTTYEAVWYAEVDIIATVRFFDRVAETESAVQNTPSTLKMLAAKQFQRVEEKKESKESSRTSSDRFLKVKSTSLKA